MIANSSVSVVVVTFHPDGEVVQHLAAVRPQVGGLVVVDNGSLPEELAPLRAWCGANEAELTENGENLGIATALNLGVRRAIALGFEYVLLFDQDSEVTGVFVRRHAAGLEAPAGWLARGNSRAALP